MRTAAVVTISDGVDAGTRQDSSGAVLAEALERAGFEVSHRRSVPDEIGVIALTLRGLIDEVGLVLTTGGTGFGPRDVTPEATMQVVERQAPGLAMLMLTEGFAKTPMAALSRGVVGSAGSTLFVNLPGSPKGATENLAAILDVIPHALDLLAGHTEH
ncbi:MAG TPA: MogA/MoaB family molybdenum cofactor biosynthesis protein [Acidimicrobiia bacterium]|nr:MogA/MoaB family molybdenum cofactor biosynthesis protein [Acidimicrobiia bacterium]